jgi:hypothetical protein
MSEDEELVGCVMLARSGAGKDLQWFDYMASFYADGPVRIEWNKDTMYVLLTPAEAAPLFANRWARPMTADEESEYNQKEIKP